MRKQLLKNLEKKIMKNDDYVQKSKEISQRLLDVLNEFGEEEAHVILGAAGILYQFVALECLSHDMKELNRFLDFMSLTILREARKESKKL